MRTSTATLLVEEKNKLKPALVTTCLQRPLVVFPLGGRYKKGLTVVATV